MAQGFVFSWAENAEGKMTITSIQVEYYYIRKTELEVNYIDKLTGEKLKQKNEETGEDETSTEKKNGHEKEEYTTDSKEFKDYKTLQGKMEDSEVRERG